jgi:D-alanine transaminase
MPELAYVNGRVTPIEEAVIPIEDRGYQFGDAVYEVIASRNGKLFRLDAHLDRLDRSMEALALPPMPREKIRNAVLDLYVQAAIPRAAVYMQISRGVYPRNHAYPANPDLQFVMTVRSVADMPDSCRTDGVQAITVEDQRWGRCDIKTVQLLPNIMAKQSALNCGVADAIFLSEEGIVREGTSSNLFIARNGHLITHPLTPRILGGITRMVILEICREKEIPVEERCIPVREMMAAEEVFFTGTISEVLPIVRIDGKPVGGGRVGPLATRLYRELILRMTEGK